MRWNPYPNSFSVSLNRDKYTEFTEFKYSRTRAARRYGMLPASCAKGPLIDFLVQHFSALKLILKWRKPRTNNRWIPFNLILMFYFMKHSFSNFLQLSLLGSVGVHFQELTLPSVLFGAHLLWWQPGHMETSCCCVLVKLGHTEASGSAGKENDAVKTLQSVCVCVEEGVSGG